MDLLSMLKSSEKPESMKKFSSGNLNDPEDIARYEQYKQQYPVLDKPPEQKGFTHDPERFRAEYLEQNQLSKRIPGEKSELLSEKSYEEYLKRHSLLEAPPDDSLKPLSETDYNQYVKDKSPLELNSGDKSKLHTDYGEYVDENPVETTGYSSISHEEYLERHPRPETPNGNPANKEEYSDYQERNTSEKPGTEPVADYNGYLEQYPDVMGITKPSDNIINTENYDDFSSEFNKDYIPEPNVTHVKYGNNRDDPGIYKEVDLDNGHLTKFEEKQIQENQKDSRVHPAKSVNGISPRQSSYEEIIRKDDTSSPVRDRDADWVKYTEDKTGEYNKQHSPSSRMTSSFTGYNVNPMKNADMGARAASLTGDDNQSAKDAFNVYTGDAWKTYGSNVKDSALKLADSLTNNKDRNKGSTTFRKNAHVNTNMRMVGYIPNPLMIAEGQSSAMGEIASGAAKLMSTGMSAINGLGGSASTAMSWLNWTCPSYAYVLPPGVSWAWSKASTFLDMAPVGEPSDSSLASSIGDLGNKVVSFASNFNKGYNDQLIKTAKNRINWGKSEPQKNFIRLSQDAENGVRSSAESVYSEEVMKGLEAADGKGKQYKFGIRKKGSDLTGHKLRQYRLGYGDKTNPNNQGNMTDPNNLVDYDRYTFYEFTYPLISSVENHRFRGVLQNLDYNAGHSFKIDFIIEASPSLMKRGLPSFSYKNNGKDRDLSYLCDISLSSESLQILGTGKPERDNHESGSGINQGPWGTYNTYARQSSRLNSFTTTIHETENYDVFRWMKDYYKYYFYQTQKDFGEDEKKDPDRWENRKGAMQSWLSAFTNTAVHRSPYESYYYIHLCLMKDLVPSFWNYVYMVVPKFEINFASEDMDGRSIQSYTITWEVIGQVKNNINDTEKQIEMDSEKNAVLGSKDSTPTEPAFNMSDVANAKGPDEISNANGESSSQVIDSSVQTAASDFDQV